MKNTFELFWKELSGFKDNIKNLENTVYTIGDDKLYPVEIHVLAEIYKIPEIGVIEISKNLGVTKGAVSQKIKILCKKGFLSTKKAKANKKILLLTDKGENICRFHNKTSLKMAEDIKLLFDYHSNDELTKLANGLSLINNYLKNYKPEDT
jgi:DNA-binding MarR family transcriptional regulator